MQTYTMDIQDGNWAWDPALDEEMKNVKTIEFIITNE